MSVENIQDGLHDTFPDLLQDFCTVTQLDTQKLRETTTLYVTDSDERTYFPYPQLRQDRDGRHITLVCNTRGYAEGWQEVYEDVDGMDELAMQRLYLATGMAWVGIVHAAYDAQQARPKESEFALRRLNALMRQLHDKRAIENTISELEVSEKIEATLFPLMPEEKEIEEINRVRYALGLGYMVLDLPEQIRDDASEVFVDRFADYTGRLGANLISMSKAFGLGTSIEPEVHKQHGIVKAFHGFYFGGIIPMDMSDIMNM